MTEQAERLAPRMSNPTKSPDDAAVRARVASLPIWSVPVEPKPLAGGISNKNYVVEDRGRRAVVRVGDDNIVHGVLRTAEVRASRAAHAAGVSPAVLYTEPGILVIDFIEGRTLTPEDVRKPANLPRLVDLVRRVHHDIPKHLRGPAQMFWVFHVLRDYGHSLEEAGSRYLADVPRLMSQAEELERAVGPIDVVFGHNDLLAANFVDDGQRLWLLDWEYSGFNSPLFDLGGLISNSELSAAMADEALALYFGCEVDQRLRYRYTAMTAASLLRETMWSMVSELHSRLSFDYSAYTAENLARYEKAFAHYKSLERP